MGDQPEAKADLIGAQTQPVDLASEVEKGTENNLHPGSDYEPSLYDGVQRKMEQRHIQVRGAVDSS